MDLGLADQTALVTGGGRGIRKGIALALAREGVHVAIASRAPDPATVAELEAQGVRAMAIRADVSSEEQVETMVAAAIDRLGRLDLFVSNAGATWHEPVTRLTRENVQRTLDTNLYAAMWGSRAAARHMLSRGSGSILVVASTIAYNPGYKESAYRVSKAGLRAFAETMALELGPHGIRVNILTPGLTRTDMGKGLDAVMADPEIGPPLMRDVPLRRLGEWHECGSAAAFLLSDRVSSYITGADLVVDGGFHLRPLRLVDEDEVRTMNAPDARDRPT
jgi:NAD(P)-dependent dehydrogenase (short-subunit alcohol dehydrogenase family)